jgi:hypothetical protein
MLAWLLVGENLMLRTVELYTQRLDATVGWQTWRAMCTTFDDDVKLKDSKNELNFCRAAY